MMRFVIRLALAGALAVAGYLAWISGQIAHQSQIDEAEPADVILVLGAAEYHGRPSPVFRARLDHALDLYNRKFAPRILTTGGSGGDPVFTEGEVGRTYLMRNGVPSESIIVEPEGVSTAHSIAAAGEIHARMQLTSSILVSDGYHIYRAKKMLESKGVRVFGSPTEPGSGANWWLYVRQSVGYLLWNLGLQA